MALRRRIFDNRKSRLAIWAQRLALFALAAAFLSIIIVRSGLLEIEPALTTFGGALFFAILSILFGFAALVAIWRDGVSGIGNVFIAFGISLLLLAYPAYLGTLAYKLPPISDITTDPIDPPRFDAIARLRTRQSNRPEYAGLYAAEQQRAAYPDVAPVIVPVDARRAYDAVVGIIGKRRWRIVDARPPQAGRRDGLIEAVARTPIMGFRDDIVIRLRPVGEETRVDMRSASRYGRHDLGTNARRVQNTMQEIDDTIEPPAPEKEKEKKTQKGRQPSPNRR